MDAPATADNMDAPATDDHMGGPATDHKMGAPATDDKTGAPATADNMGVPAAADNMSAPPFNPGFPLCRREMKKWAESLGISRRSLERTMGVRRSKWWCTASVWRQKGAFHSLPTVAVYFVYLCDKFSSGGGPPEENFWMFRQW